MHRLTKEALNRLRADKINFEVEDILELNDYAERTEKISDQQLLKYSGKYCGNVEIFPLSLGAKLWLKTDALKYFIDDEDIYYTCLFYAYANSRYPEKFIFKDAKHCRKIIKKWSKTVNATEEEIINFFSDDITNKLESENIVNAEIILNNLYENMINNPNRINLVPVIKFLNKTDDYNNKDEGSTPIIAWLLSNLGQTPEYWLWEVDWSITERMIEEKIKQEYNKQGITKENIDPQDPSFLAMFKFQNKLKTIRGLYE